MGKPIFDGTDVRQALGKSVADKSFRRIAFQPSRNNTESLPLASSLTPLNAHISVKKATETLQDGANGSSYVKDKKKLYSGPIALQWPKIEKIGAGLNNLGNTCFLNAVLQCLTYTPPLAVFSSDLKYHSSDTCRHSGFCCLCMLTGHVRRALTSPGRTISPRSLAQNIKQISKCFRLGRQEDAHEFARTLLESMQQACLRSVQQGGGGKPSPQLAETTFVYRTFGGRLRSQVTCTSCKYNSNTYDPFLDLSLEIHKAPSLLKALSHFTQAEVLDGANKYRCSKCKHMVKALKRFTIDKAPKVLTLQLKRFRFGSFGGKIDRMVDFPTTLNLSPYMSATDVRKVRYSLYGVLVHAGHSTHSGHYFCYVKSAAGTWYNMDDCHVGATSERTVLSQRAYMLFYIRQTDASHHKPPASAPSSPVRTPAKPPPPSTATPTTAPQPPRPVPPPHSTPRVTTTSSPSPSSSSFTRSVGAHASPSTASPPSLKPSSVATSDLSKKSNNIINNSSNETSNLNSTGSKVPKTRQAQKWEGLFGMTTGPQGPKTVHSSCVGNGGVPILPPRSSPESKPGKGARSLGEGRGGGGSAHSSQGAEGTLGAGESCNGVSSPKKRKRTGRGRGGAEELSVDVHTPTANGTAAAFSVGSPKKTPKQRRAGTMLLRTLSFRSPLGTRQQMCASPKLAKYFELPKRHRRHHHHHASVKATEMRSSIFPTDQHSAEASAPLQPSAKVSSPLAPTPRAQRSPASVVPHSPNQDTAAVPTSSSNSTPPSHSQANSQSNSQSNSQPQSRSQSQSSKKNTDSKTAAAVVPPPSARDWMRNQGKFATKVAKWEGATGSPALSSTFTQTPRNKRRLEAWDEEYDLGRLKKVRSKNADQAEYHEANPFQTHIAKAKARDSAKKPASANGSRDAPKTRCK